MSESKPFAETPGGGGGSSGAPPWSEAAQDAVATALEALLAALEGVAAGATGEALALISEHARRADGAGDVGDVGEDARGDGAPGDGRDAALRVWARLLRERAHVIARGGSAALLAHAYAHGDSSVVSMATERWLERGRWKRPWLKRVGRPVDPELRACERTLGPHAGGAAGVVALADGRRAVSAGADGVLRVWDLATGACTATLDAAGAGAEANARSATTALALHPDGARVVSGAADGALRLWDVSGGVCERAARVDVGAITALLVEPGGARVVAAGAAGTLAVWVLAGDEAGRAWTLEGHVGPVAQLALHPDGARVLSAGADGAVRVWDLARGPESRYGPARGGAVVWVGLTADGKEAYSLSATGTVRVWSFHSGDCVSSEDCGLRGARGAALRPDGRLLVLGEDFSVYEWWHDARVRSCAIIARDIAGAVFTPSGRHVALWTRAGVVEVYDTKTWRCAAISECAGLREVVAMPEERLAFVTADDEVLMYEIAQSYVSIRLRPGDALDLRGRLFSDGDLFFSSRPGVPLRAIVHATGERFTAADAHDGAVRALASRPDVWFVVTAGDDGALRAWDRESGEALARWDGDAACTAVALGKDGAIVLGDAAGEVCLFR